MADKADQNSHISAGWHVQAKAPNPYSASGNVSKDLTSNPVAVGYGQPGLGHAGYGASTALAQVKVVAPAVPATTVLATNSTGYDVIVTITANGATITAVKVGVAGQTYAQATQEAAAAGTFVVPPNGVIGIAYTGGPPTWTWTD